MAKLKVYCIGNLDGTHSAIVAAPTKAAACEAMDAKGRAKKEVELLDSEPVAYYGDGPALALASPGIPWKREQRWYLGQPGSPWTCSDEPAGAMAIVRARFPEATARSTRRGGGWEVWIRDGHDELGGGDTESAAWIDAARILSIEPPPGLPENAIVVWVEGDAPEAFRSLRAEGPLWYAWVPDEKVDDRFVRMGFLAGSRVERYPVRGGEVRIGVG